MARTLEQWSCACGRDFGSGSAASAFCRRPGCHTARCQAAQGSGRPEAMLAPPPSSSPCAAASHIAYQSAGSGPPEIVFVGGSMATSLAMGGPGHRQESPPSGQLRPPDDLRPIGDRAARTASTLSAPPTIDGPRRRPGGRRSPRQGSPSPILFGTHNGGAVAALYAARHPVRQLVLCNTWARLAGGRRLPDRVQPPCPRPPGGALRDRVGQRAHLQRVRPALRRRAARSGRAGVDQPQSARSPSSDINRHYDIRSVLPTISVPTLVIHLEDNANIPPDARPATSREAIPGARLVLLPGTDHVFLRNYAHARDRRSGAVRHRPPLAVHRPHADHHPVHRHRRLDPAGRLARRRGLERAHRRAQRRGEAPGRRPRWSGAEEHRRRLPGRVRRGRRRAGRPLRPGLHGRRAQPRAGAAGRSPRRGGVPAWARTTCRAWPCTSPSGSAGAPKADQVLVSAAVREGCAGSGLDVRPSGARSSSRGSRARGRSSRPACRRRTPVGPARP